MYSQTVADDSSRQRSALPQTRTAFRFVIPTFTPPTDLPGTIVLGLNFGTCPAAEPTRPSETAAALVTASSRTAAVRRRRSSGGVRPARPVLAERIGGPPSNPA